MTNLTFQELDKCFRNDDFPTIENDNRGLRYLKLRSMSRRESMESFCTGIGVDLSDLPSREYFMHVFDTATISNEDIDNFIKSSYLIERNVRQVNEENLIDQLCRLQHFDWGGSHGNSLEKNIVDNYVKKIQSYEKICEEIEGSLLTSLKGYTLNSWYNHWTSILIEDLFKDHDRVLPTIGLVKKIDFFINNTPFDLKVTYFPEQLLEEKLKSKGFGVELTRIKQICRELTISIPSDLSGKPLKNHLLSKVTEDLRPSAQAFVRELKSIKTEIIREAESNPNELKVWFYENQGEARFDASNRFFLVLTDENDLGNSWKLKRNIRFLREKITAHLNTLASNSTSLETEFYWKKTDQSFKCKSDILFVKFGVNDDH